MENEETSAPDTIVQLAAALDGGLAVRVYQSDGDMQQFIGEMVISLPLIPLTMGVAWHDGTPLAKWSLFREPSSEINPITIFDRMVKREPEDAGDVIDKAVYANSGDDYWDYATIDPRDNGRNDR